MSPPDRERRPAGPRAPLQTQHSKRSSRSILAPELSAELAKATPLRTAVIASSKWGWKKIDKGLDAAVVAAGTGVVVWIGAHYSGALHNAFEAVVNWLEIAAKPLL
jgi:hypothetical protein